MKKQQHYIVKPKIELGNKAGIQVWFVAISIAILTFVILSPSLKCGFTNFDEEQFVIQNPLIVSKSIELKKIFTSIVGANDYYPITIISFACNYQIGKLKPFGYHFLNVLFHTLNTFFVFIFIFIISKRNLLIAAIVALFFGIHPMHVESVTWITERKDVLFMFFFLTGLITYLIYREKRKMVWIILTIFLFVFSCLSKGTAVVFPAILILIDYLLEAKLNKKMFIVKIPFFLLSLAFIILTFLLHNNESLQFKMEHKTLLHRFIFASYDLLWYLYKFIIPNNLSAYYAYPNENAIPLSYWISPVLLLGGLIISYIYLRKVKPIVFGLLFYFFSIILMLQIIPTGSGNFNMADRYSYLSFIGLLFVIAYLLNRVWQKKTKFRYIIMVIVGIYSVIFCYSTFARTKVWQNSETLWTDVISKNPDRCYLAYYNRGHYYQFEKNDLEKALSDYNKTIELYSSSAEAFNNRGLIYFYKGRIDLALIDYNKSLELNPNFGKAYSNRGLVYYKKGENDLAMKDYNKSIKLSPDLDNAYYNRGLLHEYAYKQYDLALADYNKALELKPDYTEVYFYKGILLTKMGRNELAIDNFKKATELASTVPDYWIKLSEAENKLGRKQEAITDAIKAQQLGMQIDINYLNELGIK